MGSLCVRDEDGVGACRLEEEQTCARPSDCPAPLACVGGACTEICATDRDCPRGSWCEGDVGARGCVNLSGSPCTASFECPEGLRCAVDGLCRPPCRADLDCDFGETCTSGLCSLIRVDGGMSVDAGTDAQVGDADIPDSGAECSDPSDCVAARVTTADCVAGRCTIVACTTGFDDCDGDFGTGCDLDVRTDPLNCGVCDGQCGAGGICTAGACDTVVDVSIGLGQTCVARSSGIVLCSGFNTHGALGRGTTSPFGLTMAPIATLSDATGVECGPALTCFERAGTAGCVGNDTFGQVGDGGGFALAITLPTVLSGMPEVAEISAGGSGILELVGAVPTLTLEVAFACARQTSGAVLCWGAELYRGDGVSGDANAPVVVPGLTALDVSAGGHHVCAVRTDGTVVCWGTGGAWLGPAGSADSSTPVVVAGITDATHVAAGATHSCVRHATGAVSCWGEGPLGELGADVAGGTSATPVSVVGITDAIDIEVGVGFSCALRSGGQVSCWGTNAAGQLGIGTTGTGGFMPMTVPGLTDAALLALDATACVLRSNGAVACWGGGTPSPTDRPDFPATPTP